VRCEVKRVATPSVGKGAVCVIVPRCWNIERSILAFHVNDYGADFLTFPYFRG
jgi:hypothetical protein